MSQPHTSRSAETATNDPDNSETATPTSVPADLPYGQVWPSLAQFRQLATDRRVIPVLVRLVADTMTPVGVYRQLAGTQPGTFLLESATEGVWSRWSIIGAGSRATLTERDGHATWLGEPPVGVPTDGDPMQAVADTLQTLHTPQLAGLPPLTSGLVGYVSWDAIRSWERIPANAADELQVPQLSLSLASDMAVMDHHDGTIWLIANAINYDATDERVDEAYADAVARVTRMTRQLAADTPGAGSALATYDTPSPDIRSRSTHQEYVAAVEAGKAAIVDGEVFQVVVAQRFETDCHADALDVYRVLRAHNPSPYMYLYRTVDGQGRRLDVVGSSPEALVTLTHGEVVTHPIAGTRPRGQTPAADAELGSELLADEKERAEHVMLVDLSRNDLSRVCEPGTVAVTEFMQIERYSHVMHLVSTVEGHLAAGNTAYDVLRATFPAGTLSGAPKVRAMELIDELEPVSRGLYGGVVGYFDVAGNMDMAIAIRTALIRERRAYVQAGAGIVADSQPESEYQESCNKAAAALRAVAAAGTMAPISPAWPDRPTTG